MSDFVAQDAMSKRRRFVAKFLDVPNRHAVTAAYDLLVTNIAALEGGESRDPVEVARAVSKAMQAERWLEAPAEVRQKVASELVKLMQEADLGEGADEALDEAWDILCG